MSEYRGQYLWYELMTSDVDAAKAFYTEIVGWSTQDWEGAKEPYAMFVAGEQPVAGLMVLPEMAKSSGAPPHWLAYVGAPDVDDVAKKVTEGGGTVLAPPMDIPTVGRMVIFRDPQGAVTAAFTPADDSPEQDDESRGFAWNELATANYEEAFEFYSSLFGWETTQDMDMGEMGIYRLFGKGEKSVGGMFNKSADMPGPPFWLHYITVDSVADAVKRVEHHGGKVLNGPMPVPGGDIIAQCLDPQGAAFALFSSAPAEDA